ncbi:type II toxin-antitoxin system HigB family toxin [Tardiphaga alba]|uniref:Type II toxin-antitoxin system HigB family toxin n=2 Tax=Tardiphaga alba TaxID=340268 RepID=A0ABX8AFR9_9BRAD|nr:type II toxin-antitoxin system HigB family toxin [Tardiphaga alba]
MRIIKRSTLAAFWRIHPETAPSLKRWQQVFRAAQFTTMDDVARAFPKAKILNADRARFEIAGGNYRMIVAFDFSHQIAWIKFLGTHDEYDAIDALRVSMF